MKHTIPLNENRRFRALYARGKTASGRLLAAYTLPNRIGRTRLGITVSGKIGGAVVRNRIRRRIKEAYRLNEARFAVGVDLVLVSRHNAVSADFHGLEAELLRVCAKLGVVR